MASEKLALVNEVRDLIVNEASLPEITSDNAIICIGGILRLEILNKHGLTLALAPVSRQHNEAKDRCQAEYEYIIALSVYKKLTTQDQKYVNAASEAEIGEVDEMCERIEDLLYDTHFTNFTFKELESDIQLDPEAFDHGFFKHGTMLRYWSR